MAGLVQLKTRTRALRSAGLCAVILVALQATLGISGQSASQHFESAGQFAQAGKLDDAEREYRLGLALDPHSAEAYNNLAALYFQRRQFRNAADAFGKAHELKPTDPTIGFNFGLALFNAGDASAAIPPLQLGSSDPKRSFEAHYLLGVCYSDLKQWERAIGELEAARNSHPADERVLFVLAKDYRYAGDSPKSLDAAAELLKTHPNSPFVHEMLGEAYDTFSEPQKSEEEFKQAIAASPETPELHFMLGYLYWRWKHYDQAVAPLEAEIRISPAFAPSYYYLGAIALRDRDLAQAKSYFQRALRLDPTYGEADLGMGEVLADSGSYQDSVKFLRRAVELLPGRVEPHYWLGRTLIRLGRSDEAREELAQAYTINRDREQKATELLDQALSPQ
jgi:tetratricopeptide (TPR) repeat protein